MSWAYEGIECYVLRKPVKDFTPLYRAWNGSDHFYTTSKTEYDGLPNKYSREGIACYIRKSFAPMFVPLHRLYKGAVDDHFYCISPAEKDNAVKAYKYTYEGIIGYVMPYATLGFEPLYRAWNPEISDHFYTINVAEIDSNGPTLTKQKLENMLTSQLSGYTSGVKIYKADKNYFCPTEKVAQDIITQSKIAQRRYISEIHDCDDFAHLLKAAFIEDAYDSGRRSMPYAFGIIWGTTPAHAMDVLVLGDGKDFSVRLVEPQSGTIYKVSDNMLRGIYLIII